jgi:hypothetical protein
MEIRVPTLKQRGETSSSRGTGPEAAPVTLQTGDACGQCLHSTVARGTDILTTYSYGREDMLVEDD